MSCKALSARYQHNEQQPRSSVNANTPPAFIQSKGPDFYICDAPPPSSSLLAKAAPMLSLNTTSQLFGVLAPPQTQPLPPPNDKRLQVLYDVFRQLDGLDVSVKLSIPIKHLNKDGRTVTGELEGRIGEHGSIDALEVDLSPSFRQRIPYASEVPILGLGFHIYIPRVWLNKKTRRLHAHTKAGILYLLWPFAKIGGVDMLTGDQHKRLLNMAKLSPETRHGPGYNLNKYLPRYPWQLAEIALKMVAQKDFQETIKSAGLDTVKPDWDKAEIVVEGDFSCRDIVIADKLNIAFAPVGKRKHRLRISGKFLRPELRIEGIRSIQLDDGKSALKFASAKKTPDPIQARFRLYPDRWSQPDIMLDHFKSDRVTFETTADPGKPRAHLDLQEGIELRQLVLRLRDTGPELDIGKLIAKQAKFEGLGIDLTTEPGGRTTLENFTFRRIDGKPRVEADLKGQSAGTIRYGTETGSHGQIKFRIQKEASGHILAGPDPTRNNRPHVQVSGQIEAEMPEIDFLVQSKELAAFVQIELEGAQATGQGRLRVWTDTKEAVLEALGRQHMLTLQGSGGKVRFYQNPSEVAAWPELKKHLGAAAKDVITDLKILPSDIRFSVQRMDVKASIHPQSAKPTLNITDASLRDIQITGDVYGQVFVRHPFILPPRVRYFPIHIPEKAMMKGAKISIARIQDHTSNGARDIHISDVEIEGVESQATFSKRNQRLCGIDRKHIHARIGLFNFSPQSRDFQIGQVDEHFHIYLENRLYGGCIKID